MVILKATETKRNEMEQVILSGRVYSNLSCEGRRVLRPPHHIFTSSNSSLCHS